MRKTKLILFALLLLLIVIQFFRPERNIHNQLMGENISAVYPIPAEVEPILKKACLDCHSNNTSYPWYANVQPVAWWLDHHIQEGKHELNFDEFSTYRPRKQYHKMREVLDQVKRGEMPLPSYTWIHKDALLTDGEKKLLINWSETTASAIRAKYGDSVAERQRP